jgi:hypothetical protein
MAGHVKPHLGMVFGQPLLTVMTRVVTDDSTELRLSVPPPQMPLRYSVHAARMGGFFCAEGRVAAPLSQQSEI